METKEIVKVENTGVLAFQEPQEFLSRVSSIATPLSQIIEDKKLYANIQGRKFVTCEGWTTLASLCGLLPSIENLEIVKEPNGVIEAKATAVLIKRGEIVARAVAFCRSDEQKFSGKRMQEKYEVASMAQTRAVSKVCRIALSWIMTMAGYEATPAEEITPEMIVEPEQRHEETLTEAQQRMIHALLEKSGIIKEDRKKYVEGVIGRKVEDIKDLTKLEASKVIERLKKDINGGIK